MSRVSADFADILDAHAESISNSNEDVSYAEARQRVSFKYSGFDDADSLFDEYEED